MIAAIEVERRALQVFDSVRGGVRYEDARVELKSALPANPAAAARRIAGHCNAARSAWVMWIIGLGEDGRVSETRRESLGEWWPKVKGHFDGLAPDLLDLWVPTGGDWPLLALVFDCNRRPFVWKNADYGAGDKVEREVPWREGTLVRSARRDELLRVLVPPVPVPHVEVLAAFLTFRTPTENNRGDLPRWQGNATLLFTPTGPGVTVFHASRICARLTDFDGSCTADLSVQPHSFDSPGFQQWAQVRAAHDHILVQGPGVAHVDVHATIHQRTYSPSRRVVLDMALGLPLNDRLVIPRIILGEFEMSGSPAGHRHWEIEAREEP